MVTFEEKAGGGHVAIFVDTKHSAPEATTTLGSEEARRKWLHCLAWREESEAAKILRIGPKDCFLVVASWRSGDPVTIQATRSEAVDDDSRILVLGRTELARFYTPTLVSRPHLILCRDLAGFEEPAAAGPRAAAAGGDSLQPQAGLRDPTP